MDSNGNGNGKERKACQGVARHLGEEETLKRRRVCFEKLNESFLNMCESLEGNGQNLAPLFLQYKSFAATFDAPSEAPKETAMWRSNRDFRFSLASFSPFDMEETCDFWEGNPHVCSQSEIYRFLVKWFGVPCPNANVNDEFVDSVEAFKRIEKMADFPFSEPFDLASGSGRHHMLTRREDVGNHNRKVFETITALRKEKNALSYVKNPRFFEESSSEDEHSDNSHVLREKVVCAYYCNGRYIEISDLVLRAFSRNGHNYINMRSGRDAVFIDLDNSQAKIAYNKGDDTVYMLVMNSMVIYRLICRHPRIALGIYLHLMELVSED